MPESTPPIPGDEKEEQDNLYNPAEQINQEKMSGVSSSGEKQEEDLQSLEEDADEPIGGKYEKSEGGKKPRKQPFTLRGVFKKKGPMALIATLLFGGGGILSFMFTPALGLVNFKEVLMGDLNDQLSAYSLRSDAVLRTKIDQRSSGICKGVVKIRCQFTTMNAKQIDRFKKAGFIIEDGDTRTAAFGRERILRMKAPDGTVINNPQDLKNLARTPAGRNLMLRAFNPVYMGFSDAVANKTFNRLGLSKASWFDPKKGATDSARAVIGSDEARSRPGPIADGDRQYMIDPESGERVYADGDNADKFNALRDEASRVNTELDNKANAVPGKALSGVLTGGLKGASIVGVVDSGCTVYNLARSVAAAAKAARALQLAQFSMVYLNTADAIKAGTATPEEVAYLGEKLAEVDTTQFIIDETQQYTGTETSPSAVFASLEETPNPNYGKSAYDSPGFKVAAYNEAPQLTAQSLQYTIGGGLTGSFSGVTDDIVAAIPATSPADIRATCSVVQSWWVRIGGLAIGALAAIGTGGISLAVSVGGSIALAAAAPFLEAYLIDIIKGQVVGPDTDSVDAGDALFAGTAHINGQMAQARGMKPLTDEGLQEYLAINEEVQNEYIAAARYEAKDTPFDIMNQYSFLGSFGRTLYPSVTKVGSSVTHSVSAIPEILSTSLASILPNASANSPYNADRFNQCVDPGYEELGISADVFCNVRYGLSQAELNLDPVAVMERMYDAGHITNSGLPKSDSYKDFIEYCVEREDGWGENGVEGSTEDQDKFIGKICMEENAQISDFRVFTMDSSIVQAMDEEEQSVASQAFDIVSPVSETASVTSKFGPRSCAGCSKWHQGLDLVSNDGAVFSIMDGEVTNISRGGLNNNVVTIRHADGLISTYWHMRLSDIDSFIAVGDTVTAGEQIGIMGNEGQSRGVHLHIELNIANVENREEYEELYTVSTGGYAAGNRIDPLDFFTKNGVPGF